MEGKKVIVNVIKKRILVKIEEQKEETEKGLIAIKLDDTDQTLGVIVGTGSEALEAKVGQRIMFNRYSGTSLTIENEPYRVMQEEDILLIITNKYSIKP